MKVAFTGPSGSGKTTLVYYAKELLDLPWLNASSGQLKTQDDNEELTKMGLTVGKGHKEVIQSGHSNPQAAIENQRKVLLRRIDLIKKHDRFVTDRSPIDNYIYYITQCGIYDTEENSKEFLEQCRQATLELTHVVFIPTMIPIEDNGSRIPNWYYQKAISTIFDWEFENIRFYARTNGAETQFLKLNTISLNQRKQELTRFLNG